MFATKDGKERDSWRDGVYLTTVEDSLQADILESKLKSEGIPAERRYEGASNYMEIFMGRNFAFPIELYVPKECLEDAKNIIVPIPLTDEEFDAAQKESGEAGAEEASDEKGSEGSGGDEDGQ